MTSRQDAACGEPQVARDAENRGLADCLCKLARGRQRRVGLHGEHDDVDAVDDLIVAAAGDAELRCSLLRSLGVPRADQYLVLADLVETFGERSTERTGPADDGDLHANATA